MSKKKRFLSCSLSGWDRERRSYSDSTEGVLEEDQSDCSILGAPGRP